MPLDIESAQALVEKYEEVEHAENPGSEWSPLDKAEARLVSLLILPVGPTITELKNAFKAAYPKDQTMHDLPMNEILAFSELVRGIYQQMVNELQSSS